MKAKQRCKKNIKYSMSTHCAERREAIFVHFFPLHSFNTTIYWKKGGRSKNCVGHPAATTSIKKHTLATFFEYCPKFIKTDIFFKSKIQNGWIGRHYSKLEKRMSIEELCIEIRQSTVIIHQLAGTNDSSTKRLMFQALYLFHNFL